MPNTCANHVKVMMPVEVMMPVVSRAAWPCLWRMIPFDGASFWGIDNAWYPVCAAEGLCRFAVTDAMPVHHLHQRLLDQDPDANLRELDCYSKDLLQPWKTLEFMDKLYGAPGGDEIPARAPRRALALQAKLATPKVGAPAAHAGPRATGNDSDARTVCSYFKDKPVGQAFYSIRKITLADKGPGATTCPEHEYWGDVKNVPW
ncbi:hypothetical protein H9P43_005514 [Blastocladiella emersonii ATCC 22665]|nr:hypothetical protein H9P43_005514 [Blastocladiella emersonii ATCC 22665]